MVVGGHNRPVAKGPDAQRKEAGLCQESGRDSGQRSYYKSVEGSPPACPHPRRWAPAGLGVKKLCFLFLTLCVLLKMPKILPSHLCKEVMFFNN